MNKAKVFIASSIEGLPIAEAVFSEISIDTDTTLWKHGIFQPSSYPLDTLEEQLSTHEFAVLIASPDDILIKRGQSSYSMRDNILFELGMFSGALGRKRAFILIPKSIDIMIPSDLFGLIMAKYDDKKICDDVSQNQSAVQIACSQIRQIIRKEYQNIINEKKALNLRLIKSEKGQSLKRLYDVTAQLHQTIAILQKDIFEAISDHTVFQKVKNQALDKIMEIENAFFNDAKILNVENELKSLVKCTYHALEDMPFPKELALNREEWKNKAINIGIEAIGGLFQGEDPVGSVRRSAGYEIEDQIVSLKKRFSEWWSTHFPLIQSETISLYDALLKASMDLSMVINI